MNEALVIRWQAVLPKTPRHVADWFFARRRRRHLRNFVAHGCTRVTVLIGQAISRKAVSDGAHRRPIMRC